MPAKSKSQQRFMGMVHSAQKGGKAASPEVAKVAKNMKKKDAKDFASTSHKGLPGHVKEQKITEAQTWTKAKAEKTYKAAYNAAYEKIGNKPYWANRDYNDKFTGQVEDLAWKSIPATLRKYYGDLDEGKKLTGKSVKEQKIREYVRKAVREALVEAHNEKDLIEAKKKGHGRRKIGSKKRRAIKKRRDARKLGR